MQPEAKFNAWYIVFTVLGVMLFQLLFNQAREIEHITYSEFQTYLREGKLAEIVISPSLVQGSFKSPLADGRSRFVATRVEPELAAELDRHGVRYAGTSDNTFLATLLSWIAPILLFFALWIFVFPKISERAGLGGG
jgi:cell division protease FtsH